MGLPLVVERSGLAVLRSESQALASITQDERLVLRNDLFIPGAKPLRFALLISGSVQEVLHLLQPQAAIDVVVVTKEDGREDLHLTQPSPLTKNPLKFF